MRDLDQDGLLVAVGTVQADHGLQAPHAVLHHEHGASCRPRAFLLEGAGVDDPLAALRRACRPRRSLPGLHDVLGESAGDLDERELLLLRQVDHDERAVPADADDSARVHHRLGARASFGGERDQAQAFHLMHRGVHPRDHDFQRFAAESRLPDEGRPLPL
eukprot:7825371-Heterocapsa_arctica.AAC.2